MAHTRERILRNAARCYRCRRVVECTARDEIARCSCHDLTLSGGRFYFGFHAKENAHYELYRETEQVNCTSVIEDTPFGRRCFACGYDDAAS